MAVFRHSIHPKKSCGFFIYMMGELDTHMNEHIQAAVTINEKNFNVKIELSNLKTREIAYEAAEVIIAALAHTTGIEIIYSPIPLNESLH